MHCCDQAMVPGIHRQSAGPPVWLQTVPPLWLERGRMLIAERDSRRAAGQPPGTPRQWLLPPTVAATTAAAGAGGLHVVGEPTLSLMAEDQLSHKRKARHERRSHKRKTRYERRRLLSSSDSPSESSSTTTSSDVDMEELKACMDSTRDVQRHGRLFRVTQHRLHESRPG